ncbi:transposase [Microtetraspora fusca]|uniref:Transposase n=1 Tax=Microtetraspora fusca TaxID=1997 RepID=A0ABW6VD19_MICFU
MARWVGTDGYEVEHILLDRRPVLRVSRTVSGVRFLVAYCGSVAEVRGHVDLATLVEVVDFPTS